MVAALQAENAELKAENHRLNLRVKALEQELYGSRIDASVVGSILCARFADHQPY
jgi:cell division protein FtsB